MAADGRGDVDASSGRPQGPQGWAPGDDLDKHRVERVLLVRRRGELAVIGEVGHQAQAHLCTNVSDPKLTHDQAEVLDRAGATVGAVADETGRLVGPLAVQVVDRVLEGSGGGTVVLGCDEDVAVKPGHLLRPR